LGLFICLELYLFDYGIFSSFLRLEELYFSLFVWFAIGFSLFVWMWYCAPRSAQSPPNVTAPRRCRVSLQLSGIRPKPTRPRARFDDESNVGIVSRAMPAQFAERSHEESRFQLKDESHVD
jgi:hypothetical protein